MSVTSFKLIHEGRGGSDNVDGGESTYIDVYRVETDSATDDKSVIEAYVGCPQLLAQHPRFGYATLRSRDFRNEAFSKKVWILTCTYSTKSTDPASTGGSSSPLDTAARISWRSETYTACPDGSGPDTTGANWTNSAGDPFDPPPEWDESRWVVTITKNMVFVPAWLLNFQDSVNDAPWFVDGVIIPTQCAKVQNIEISSWQYHNNNGAVTAYREVTIGVAISSHVFALKVLNRGFNQIVGGVRKKIKITDDDGRSVEPSAPVRLDDNGAVLAVNGTDSYKTFYPYRQMPFGMLPVF